MCVVVGDGVEGEEEGERLGDGLQYARLSIALVILITSAIKWPQEAGGDALSRLPDSWRCGWTGSMP